MLGVKDYGTVAMACDLSPSSVETYFGGACITGYEEPAMRFLNKGLCTV